MRETDNFIKAYRDFKKQVDLTKGGILPEVEDLVSYIIVGIPYVPADDDTSEDAPVTAVEQRVCILKALFVEANQAGSEDFLDEGLRRYDQACEMAKAYLSDLKEPPADPE